jgi:hypothetical protein
MTIARETLINTMVTKFLSPLKRAYQYLKRMRDIRLIESSDLFDKNWYLEKNPDVAQAKINPSLHYLYYGGFEGRDPVPDFSSTWYLYDNENVKKAGINPLVHYLKYGRKEGRKAIPPLFKLSRMYDHCKQTKSIVFEDTHERIYLQRPNVVGNFSGTLNEGEALCPRPYVGVIEDAVIFVGTNMVITREGTILSDELVDFHSREFGMKSLRIRDVYEDAVTFAYNGRPDLHVKEGVFLSCGHDENYFHWLVECLPKLLFIDDLKLFKDAPLLIPAGLHRNLAAALDRININNRQLICIEPNSACQVDRLICPSALSRIVDRYEGSPVFNVDIVLSHKWISGVANLLKGNTNYNKKPWRRLFLTRKKGLRSLGNREQVESMLFERGFEIIEVDGMSLDAQIELFSQASMIVAPTGAALTNLLFCQPGTKVIIFMSNHEVTNFYFWPNLAAIVNLDVKIIAGQRLFNLTNYWSVHDDYVVDAELVLEEIRKYEQ